MKTVTHLALLGLVAVATVVSTIDTASAWTCVARSRTASGWGSAYSRAVATRIALNQCAVRTPRGYMCRIKSCR